MIVVAAFSPALDTTYEVDELVLGAPHRPTTVVRVAGGKALNMARAASRLGADVVAVPVLGGHLGDLVEELLAGDGVRARTVRSDVPTRVCVSVASAAAGTLTELYENPVPVPGSAVDAVLAAVADELRPGAWLSVSGGMPRDARPGLLVELARSAAEGGAHLALDTHGPALREVLDGGAPVALLKVNRAEAAEALGLPGATELGQLVTGLLALTGGTVVVTDGVDGALAADGTGRWRAGLPVVAGGQPVGSGDSFLGGLVAALDHGAALQEALALATGAGAANAEVPGAGAFTAARAHELAGLVRVVPADG